MPRAASRALKGSLKRWVIKGNEELDGRMLVAYEELTRKHREWRFYVMQAEDARLQGKSLLRLLVETDRIHYDASFSADALAQMTADEKYRVALSYVQQAHNPPD